MLEDKDFELLDNTPEVENNIVKEEEISDADFVLTQVDETVHEQKFQTKPTTFLKDSLKRFRKNKSSVVAAYILGALLLMSFLVPIFDTSDTGNPHPEEIYLAPKLFESGTGFWDGTVKYNKIAVDISEMPDAKTDAEKQEHWWPSSTKFPQRSAISKKTFTDEQYTNDISNLGTFGKEGYVQFGYYYDHNNKKTPNVEFSTQTFASLGINNDLSLSVFDVYDVEKVKLREGADDFTAPENYVLGESALYFHYTDDSNHKQEIKLVDYAIAHNIGSMVASLSEPKLDIANIITSESGATSFNNAYFSVRMEANPNGHNVCSLIGSIVFESTSTNEKTKQAFDEISFADATANATKSKSDGYQYWSCTGVRKIYLSKAYFCSFVYDTYEAAFGNRVDNNFSVFDLLKYEKNGWVSFDGPFGPTLMDNGDNFYLDTINFTCTILNKEKCPLAEPVQISDLIYPADKVDADGIYVGNNIVLRATITNYKVLNYSKMPKYLMGTDKSGRDMFKYVFEGLRTSLLLGVLTFVVCFLFGLLWGSICGYFGGTVDLLMERFTDILAGVPWIVVMTLIIIHMGSHFWTFALALCMTGWIGTAARTRTQFYRFRGREYVLASRTLGASDARLIAKHILPNALGTIITGAVLMIPSVIFSEATISYLGLGLKNLASLGVILSDNQAELLTSSYLLIYPAIVIALIMISFNLFGNGLRDAINPSLKGED